MNDPARAPPCLYAIYGSKAGGVMGKRLLFLADMAANALLLFFVIVVLFRGMGIRVFTVLSGSMEPTVPTGSVVLVDTHKEPKKNDIITFRMSDVYVTHRMIGEEQKGYITKGDANNCADFQNVPVEKVTGVVIAVIPMAGYILQKSRFLIWLSLGIIFLLFCRRLWHLIIKK